jgi:hypothetical protein
MNLEPQQETPMHEIELPDACAACGGPIAARFTASSARGVCLACHLITVLTVARAGDGVSVGHVPAGLA